MLDFKIPPIIMTMTIIAHMEQFRNAYRVLVERPEGMGCSPGEEPVT